MMKLPYLRPEQIKGQPDQTTALINRIIDKVNYPDRITVKSSGGGGSTTDFNQLTNRPAYNNTTMTGTTNIPKVPTKTSDLSNDGEDGTSTYVEADGLATVATSGSYNDLLNKPTIPTVNNATLTIQKNSSDIATFTSNASSNVTANISVPTDTNDLTNGAGYITSSSLPTKTSNLINDGSDGLSTYVEASSLATVATTGDYDDLIDKPSIPPDMVELSYGHSTWNEFITAYNTHSVVYCKASSNSNPGTGSQTRKAFLAYVNNDTTPTEVEFQYYRSVATHSDSQQGDQVYVYKLKSNGTWSVTVREAYTKIAAGTNMSSSYNSGTLTLSATDTTYSAGNGLSLTGTAFEIDPSVVAEVSDIPTKTSDLTNDGSDNTSVYVEADELATVATSGNYSDLSGTPTIPAAQVNSDWNAVSGVAEILNKPTIPTVNDATLTIQNNGTNVATFTANSATNTTANIVPPVQIGSVLSTPTNVAYVNTANIVDGAVTAQKIDWSDVRVSATTIWTGTLYQISDYIDLSEALVVGDLYIFTFLGNSSTYLMEFPMTYRDNYFQCAYYDGTTVVRWRLVISNNGTRITVNNNSLNMSSNTALTRIAKVTASKRS